MEESPAFNGTVNMTRLGTWRRGYCERHPSRARLLSSDRPPLPLADAAISYTDYNIGVIVDKLGALGMADDTIVVVFGDHGCSSFPNSLLLFFSLSLLSLATRERASRLSPTPPTPARPCAATSSASTTRGPR